jgi:hypothetical protein
MAKINRYNGNVKSFASESTGSERTIFGDLSQSNTQTLPQIFLEGGEL